MLLFYYASSKLPVVDTHQQSDLTQVYEVSIHPLLEIPSHPSALMLN